MALVMVSGQALEYPSEWGLGYLSLLEWASGYQLLWASE
jgi:hypothetical protein